MVNRSILTPERIHYNLATYRVGCCIRLAICSVGFSRWKSQEYFRVELLLNSEIKDSDWLLQAMGRVLTNQSALIIPENFFHHSDILLRWPSVDNSVNNLRS